MLDAATSLGMDTLSGEAARLIDHFLPPFCNGVCSERLDFTPHGNNVYPFEVDPFSESEGDWQERIQR